MHIDVTSTPDDNDLKLISQGLRAANARHIGDLAHTDDQRIAAFAREEDGTIVGGIRASTCWDWLYIEAIWVDDAARNSGVGKQLLTHVENAAVQRDGVVGACLETASFQAREFYEKLGYDVFGTLPDYPRGHTMYFMRKMFVTT